MSKGNGGPAFARPKSPKGEYTDSEVPCAQTGMSLRDYFAAKAMQGAVCAASGEKFADNLRERARTEGKDIVDVIAGDSYLVADAMLAERAK
jgi:hypothetical protein